MRIARLAVATVAAAALVPLSAVGAYAAPPANDTPGGAIAMNLGDTINEDTTKATTGTLDEKVNQFCGAPYTNGSVWFTYTPAEDGAFIVDGADSDFSTGFMIFRGAPTGRSLRACGPTQVAIRAMGGTTYTVMAFSPTQQTGGNLVISLEDAPPPPTLSFTVDPSGRAFPNGNALVKGTFTCTNADNVELFGQLTQIWQRVKITGFFHKILGGDICDGTPQPWQRVVTSDNGLYDAGAATVSINGQACGPLQCAGGRVDDVDVTLVVGSPKSAGAAAAATSSALPTAAACAGEQGSSLYDTRAACQALAVTR